MIKKILLLILFTLSTVQISAQESASPIQYEIVAEELSIQEGHPFWIALQVKIDKGWHAYWKNPGDAGAPLEVEWVKPKGFEIGQPLWPTPKRFVQDGLVSFGYDSNTTLLVKVTPPKEFSSKKPIKFSSTLGFVSCSDENCLPGESQTTLTLTPSAERPQKNPKAAKIFKEARAALPLIQQATANKRGDEIALVFTDERFTHDSLIDAYFCPEDEDVIIAIEDTKLTHQSNHQVELTLKGGQNPSKQLNGIAVLVADNHSSYAYQIEAPIQLLDDTDVGLLSLIIAAFLGGLILNLMPCVFPVLSFKVLSFVKMADKSRMHTLKYSLAYTAGIILSFWLMAAVLYTAQSYGRSVGWGFQLQEPLFVGFLTAILFVFSLNLFGLFEFGTSLMNKGAEFEMAGSEKSNTTSALLSGVLATTMAAPCTGPFLGTAISVAVTKSVFCGFIIFTSLGSGLAFPYLMLGAFPGLLRFMPKPGKWLITFKELMGFLMLATALWFIWIFGAQTSTQSTIILLLALLSLSLACWVWGKWGLTSHRTKRGLSYLLSISLVTASCYLTYQAATTEQIASSDWETYSETRVNELLAEGKPVFLDFTAAWCLSCQTNDLVLSRSAKLFEEKGITKLKGDWTKYDPTITQALKNYGRSSVPLYVLHIPQSDGSSKIEVLPQILTPSIINDYLNKLN